MSKKISVGTALILVFMTVLVTFQITFVSLNNKYREQYAKLSESQEFYSKLATVDSIYRSNYIGELDDKELMDSILYGYVAGTGDKYAYYLNEEEYAEQLADSNSDMVGVGIYVVYSEGSIEVVNVMPDSPALEAGICPGDVIVAVDGTPVENLGYSTAIDMIRGEEGTVAQFTILRDSRLIDFSIERAHVNKVSVLSRKLDSDPTVGIVKILGFEKDTPDQFINACEDLIKSGVSRFVFDVRDNLGGELSSICSILDYLLPEGPIVRIVDADGNEEVVSSDASQLDMPMCVLINRSTVSAAELFASAMKDYNKAKLVGCNTYGKGTMQTIISLPDGSGIGISTNMYNPPFSDNYEGVGIAPDIEVEMDESVAGKSIYKLADSEDTQLCKAVEVLNANR